MDQMNDLAFVVDGRLVVLVEHQSTINENMPLRLLVYIGRVYELLLDDAKIYGRKRGSRSRSSTSFTTARTNTPT